MSFYDNIEVCCFLFFLWSFFSHVCVRLCVRLCVCLWVCVCVSLHKVVPVQLAVGGGQGQLLAQVHAHLLHLPHTHFAKLLIKICFIPINIDVRVVYLDLY